MLATIWTTESGTTGTIDEDVSVKEYYQGATFRPAAILEDKLNEYCETGLYVLLKDGKYVRGEESSEILADQTGIQTEFDDGFIKSVVDSDVIVILFPSNTLDRSIRTNWERIVDHAKPNSIWCIGASRGSLEKLDLQKLENKGCEILLYQRNGVAPIGTEVRDQLVQKVRDRVR